jgi:hypothetical protein
MCYHVVDQRIEQTPSTKNSFATTAMLKPVISWAAGLRVSAGLQALQLEPWICLDTMFPWRILHIKGECVFSFLQLKAAKEQKRTPKIDADQDDDESVGWCSCPHRRHDAAYLLGHIRRTDGAYPPCADGTPVSILFAGQSIHRLFIGAPGLYVLLRCQQNVVFQVRVRLILSMVGGTIICFSRLFLSNY